MSFCVISFLQWSINSFTRLFTNYVITISIFIFIRIDWIIFLLFTATNQKRLNALNLKLHIDSWRNCVHNFRKKHNCLLTLVFIFHWATFSFVSKQNYVTLKRKILCIKSLIVIINKRNNIDTHDKSPVSLCSFKEHDKSPVSLCSFKEHEKSYVSLCSFKEHDKWPVSLCSFNERCLVLSVFVHCNNVSDFNHQSLRCTKYTKNIVFIIIDNFHYILGAVVVIVIFYYRHVLHAL